MPKILIDEAVVRQALDDLIACEEKIDSEWGDCRKIEQIDRDGDTPVSIIALRQALASAALDKMADNARELGLSYEQPLTGLLSIARKHPEGRVVTVSFRTVEDAVAFEKYAIEAAQGITKGGAA